MEEIIIPLGSIHAARVARIVDRMRTCWPTLACAAALSVCIAPLAAAEYRPPRLEDGHPDLQGVWDHVDATPLERPPGVTTLTITREQAVAIAHALDQVAEDRSKPTEPTEYFNERRMLPIRGELRSSIIVDPADGRIPGTAEFQQWQVLTRVNVVNALDGPEQRPTSERCLGNPASQPPNLFNPGTNLRQIVQTRDAVVIESEVLHFARIIRLNAKHSPAAVTSWSGDSIGWWEGDTLVVETKHFTPSDRGRVAAGITFLVSPAATVTERITRVAEDELSYVFKVDDPANYTQPWTGETHLLRKDENLLEYACHEANYSLRFILQGGRAQDAE
jgi:hypothetical protein